MSQISHTVALIKPDAFKRKIVGGVLTWIETCTPLLIVDLHKATPSPQSLEEFYAVHEGKPFFKDLISFMKLGPIVFMELGLVDGNAVKTWRDAMGPADPSLRRPGELRYNLCQGLPVMQNLVHGSDSVAEYERELGVARRHGWTSWTRGRW